MPNAKVSPGRNADRTENDETCAASKAVEREEERLFASPQLTKKRSAKELVTDAMVKTNALESLMTNSQKMAKGRQIHFIWTVYRITDIDCVKQIYSVDIRFLFEWEDGNAYPHMSQAEKSRLWYPRLIVVNKADDLVAQEIDPVRDLRIPKAGRVRMKFRIKGRLQEIFELEDFPFDTQDLQIILQSKDDYRTIGKFVPGISHRTNSYQNLPLVSWSQHAHRVHCGLSKPELSSRQRQYANIRLALIVKRRYMHYIKSIYAMIFLLTGAGFSVFSLQTDQMGERLAANFTLLLTMVSYKKAMQDVLPRLDYFTFLDQYIYVGFGMVLLVVFESVIIQKAWTARDGNSEGQTRVLDFDAYFSYAWLALWVLISVLTGLMAMLILHRNDVGPPLEITNNRERTAEAVSFMDSMFEKKFHPTYLKPLYSRFVSPSTERKPQLSPRICNRPDGTTMMRRLFFSDRTDGTCEDDDALLSPAPPPKKAFAAP